MSAVSRAEVCVAACSDLFRGAGEILVSPVGIIPTLGARLAALTHSPDLLLTDGETALLGEIVPLGSEPGVIEGYMPYRQLFDFISWGRRHVVMGAAQLDRQGNQNLSAIGPHERPVRQLLGSRAASANTVHHRTSYWISRHSTRIFVDTVDFVTGVGPSRAHETGSSATRHHDVHQVVTDLAVLDLGGPGHTLQLISRHPGVSVDEIAKRTGCRLAVAAEVPETRLPDADELRLIRTFLDPDQRRDREVPA